MKKNALLLTLTLMFSIQTPVAFSAAETVDFNYRLKEAQKWFEHGNTREASKEMELMLAANPKEWILYTTYADGLVQNGDYDRALTVYEQALPQYATDRKRVIEIEERIVQIEEEAFLAEELANAIDWDNASVLGAEDFLIKTDLPESYFEPVVGEIVETIDEVGDLMKEVLGKSKWSPYYLKIYLVANEAEYKRLQRKMLNQERRFSEFVTFHPEKHELLIHFTGRLDWFYIAKGVADYLLHVHYVASPSQLFREGVSSFIAYRLHKQLYPGMIYENIEYLNWLYDQGRWQSVEDIFTIWNKVERAQDNEMAASMQEELEHMFGLLSWSFTNFMLANSESYFGRFFEKWLHYEQFAAKKSSTQIHRFLEKELGPKKMKDLDYQWSRHLLGMEYANV